MRALYLTPFIVAIAATATTTAATPSPTPVPEESAETTAAEPVSVDAMIKNAQRILASHGTVEELDAARLELLLTIDERSSHYAESRKLARQMELAAKSAAKSEWRYGKNEDPLGRGVIKFARLASVYELNFGFPYSGAQRASLHLLRGPKGDHTVVLRIERGQFLCTGRHGCYLSIRFDEEKVEEAHFQGSQPSDGTTTMLWLKPASEFIDRLRKSKTVAIEAQFFREGARVIIFNSSGLDW